MAKVLVTEGHLNNIAEAIRAKNGAATTYRPGDMAAAIQAIPTGITPTGTKNITVNGTHDVTQFASANVNIQPNLQSKSVTQNGTVVADTGYDGLSSVIVNVPGGGGGAGPLEYIQPYAENITSGYVSNGTWVYTTDYSDLNTTVFQVEAGKSYLFILGATVERFRGMFTTQDIVQATANINGQKLMETNSPSTYADYAYTASANGYVAIYVGSRGNHVYGFEGSLP